MAPISIPEVKGVSTQQQPINPPQTPLSLGQNTNAALTRGEAQGVSSVFGALDQVRRDANRRKIDAQNEIDKLQVTNAVTGWHERTGVQFAEQSQSVTRLDALPGMVNGAFRPGFHADMAGFERDVTANIFEGLTQTQQQMFNLQIGRARGTYGIKTAGHQASQASLAKADASKSERDSFEFRGSSISNMDSPEYLELQDDVIDHVSNTNLDPESQLRLLEQIMGGVNAKVVDNDLFIAIKQDPEDLRKDLVNGEFNEFLTEGKVATWIDRVDAEIKERNVLALDANAQPIVDDLLDKWDQINTRGSQTVTEQLFPTKHPFVENADGSVSNVKLGTFEQDGIHYVIPTMVNGKQLTDDEAFNVATKEGLSNYPSFTTASEALKFSQDVHGNVNEQGQLTEQAVKGLTSNQTRRQIKSDYADDPELRDELLDRFDSESKAFLANKKVEKDRANATTRTAVDALVEVKAWDDAILEAKLNPDSVFSRKELDRIDEKRTGKVNKGNQTEYYRMVRLAGGSQAEQDEFLATDIGDLNLVTTNQNDLFERARKLLEGNQDDPDLYQGFTLTSIAADATGEMDPELKEQYNFRFGQEVEAFNRQPGREGKRATPVELQGIARSLSAQVQFDGWGFFGGRDEELQAFQLEAGDFSGFEVDVKEFNDPRMVPVNAAIEIRNQHMRDFGFFPNPQEVLQTFKDNVLSERPVE